MAARPVVATRRAYLELWSLVGGVVAYVIGALYLDDGRSALTIFCRRQRPRHCSAGHLPALRSYVAHRP